MIKWNQNAKNAVQIVVLNATNAPAAILLVSANRINQWEKECIILKE